MVNILGTSTRQPLKLQKFFVPINFNGKRDFLFNGDTSEKDVEDIHEIEQLHEQLIEIDNNPQPKEAPSKSLYGEHSPRNERKVASITKGTPDNDIRADIPSIFSDLKSLENALLTNNFKLVQSLLPCLDDHINRLITTRTKIGSIANSITTSEDSIEKAKLMDEQYRTKLEDADVAKLFSDLARQKNVLDATYKSSAQLMNQSLLNFVR